MREIEVLKFMVKINVGYWGWKNLEGYYDMGDLKLKFYFYFVCFMFLCIIILKGFLI